MHAQPGWQKVTLAEILPLCQAAAPSLYQYSLGQLVLWVPASSPLDVERQGMAVLLDSSVKKIEVK